MYCLRCKSSSSSTCKRPTIRFRKIIFYTSLNFCAFFFSRAWIKQNSTIYIYIEPYLFKKVGMRFLYILCGVVRFARSNVIIYADGPSGLELGTLCLCWRAQYTMFSRRLRSIGHNLACFTISSMHNHHLQKKREEERDRRQDRILF